MPHTHTRHLEKLVKALSYVSPLLITSWGLHGKSSGFWGQAEMLTWPVHISLWLPDLPPGRGLSSFSVPWSPKEELVLIWQARTCISWVWKGLQTCVRWGYQSAWLEGLFLTRTRAGKMGHSALEREMALLSWKSVVMEVISDRCALKNGQKWS